MLMIDHILIVAKDLAAMRAFLVDVIGVNEGPRPPFAFPGYWLYADGKAIFHLAEADASPAQQAHLGGDGPRGNGSIDHVALTGADLAGVARRAVQCGFATRLREVPVSGERQLFVQGPEGLKIELLEPRAASAKG